MNHDLHVEFQRPDPHGTVRILQCDTCSRRLALGGEHGYESLANGDGTAHTWSTGGLTMTAAVEA